MNQQINLKSQHKKSAKNCINDQIRFLSRKVCWNFSLSYLFSPVIDNSCSIDKPYHRSFCITIVDPSHYIEWIPLPISMQKSQLPLLHSEKIKKHFQYLNDCKTIEKKPQSQTRGENKFASFPKNFIDTCWLQNRRRFVLRPEIEVEKYLHIQTWSAELII